MVKIIIIYDFILVIGLSLFKIVAFLSAPICLVKTGISLLHLVVASTNLSIIDLKERQKST